MSTNELEILLHNKADQELKDKIKVAAQPLKQLIRSKLLIEAKANRTTFNTNLTGNEAIGMLEDSIFKDLCRSNRNEIIKTFLKNHETLSTFVLAQSSLSKK